MVQENAVSEGIVIGGVHDIRGISTLVSCPDPTSHKEKGLLTANEIVLHHLSVCVSLKDALHRHLLSTTPPPPLQVLMNPQAKPKASLVCPISCSTGL